MGGGAKGLAHFGVLKVIKEYNIPVEIVTGSSMGAIVGALYAIDPSLKVLEKGNIFEKAGLASFGKSKESSPMKKILSSLKDSFLKAKILLVSHIFGGEKLKEFIKELFGDYQFKDTKLKLGIITIDAKTGKEVTITEGKIADAVAVSIGVPGLLQSIKGKEELFVDGALISHVPVSSAKNIGANFVIASDIKEEFIKDSQMQAGWQIHLKIDQVAKNILEKNELAQAQIIIFPNTDEIGWADFDKINLCISRGEEAAKLALKDWHKKLRKTKIKHWFSFGP